MSSSLRVVTTTASVPQRMAPGQRRLVFAVAASAVLVFTISASFNYILSSILDEFQPSQTQSDMLRQIPSIGALLVIFAAGILGQRVGARRVMLACTVLYAVGSLLAAVAPVIEIVTLGLLLAYIGKSALVVVALAYMSGSIQDPAHRASAFSTFTAASPVAYLVMPLLTGFLVTDTTWRWVAVVWAVGGAAAFVVVWFLIPRHPETAHQQSGEMVTPLLAGAVLAIGVQILTDVSSPDGGAGRVWWSLLLLVIASATLVVAMRRITDPSLSLAPLRNRQLVLLLTVLMITVFTNLWFYTTMALQYIYELDEVDVAVAMLPPQFVAILGAGLAAATVRRLGITRTGTIMLIAVAACLVGSAQVQLDTPLWIVISLVSVYSAAALGVSVAMTNAIMDTAGKETQGLTSSYRGAASNLGSAIGVAVMTTVIFTAVSVSLDDQSTADGTSVSTADAAANSVRSGATAGDLSNEYAVPLSEAEELDEETRQAFLIGYQAHGWVGAVVILGGAALFYAVRRRAAHQQAVPAGSATPPGDD